MKKLGILLIRGSGSSGFKRQELFLERLWKQLEKNGVDASLVASQVVDWYGPIQDQQEEILRRMKASGKKLHSGHTRRLIISNIGDLINYGGKPGTGHFGYDATHLQVRQSLSLLEQDLEEGAPVVVVAASMGTEIMNDYILDRQRRAREGTPDPLGQSPVERLDTLTGLFTFGSNLAIFAASLPIDEMRPIEFPPPALADKYRPVAVWENYYDRHDSMGFPVKPLNLQFQNLHSLRDIHINTGGPLLSWNLFSHFGYWRSRKLVKRIAGYMAGLLALP